MRKHPTFRTCQFAAAVLTFAISLPTAPARAQNQSGGLGDRPPRTLWTVAKSDTPIRIDAVLDEPAWQEATVIPIAYEWLPGDNTPAPVETEVRIAWDDRSFYISYVARDPEPERIRAHVRDRDTAFADDHVLFMLDTFDDERRGFQFRVNPLGVQMDASFSELEGIEDWSWDAIWDSAGRITDEGYIVEVAVPFSSLRFPQTGEVQTWGVILERSYPRSVRHRLRSNRTDRNFASILAQGDRITGLQGISPGRNIEITPTVTAVRTDEAPSGGLWQDPPSTALDRGDPESDIGLTMKWGITPNLIVNGTVNPDFSQVEADVAQLAVNNRFALLFPERRPFFLEGADFFATPLNAIFTRTIVNPTAGVKLTGKEGRHAIGFFGARDRVNSLLFPSNQGSMSDQLDQRTTSAVLRYRYDLGSNSTVGVLATAREADGYHNRMAGVDGFLRITPTKTVNLQVLHSDTAYPDTLAAGWGQATGSIDDIAISANFQHMSRNWIYALTFQQLGTDFRADTGFIPRVDFRSYAGFLIRQVWGEPGDWYNQLQLILGSTRTETLDGELRDQDLTVIARYFGPLQSNLEFMATRWREFYLGTTYTYPVYRFTFTMRPSGSLDLGLTWVGGQTVDLLNARKADQTMLAPNAGISIGRRINANISYIVQRLSVDEGKLLTAHLPQLRLLYHFNVRTFVRAIVQYQRLDRELTRYLAPIAPFLSERSESLFTQFLFSYKVNPRTVLFLGYSDNHLGGFPASGMITGPFTIRDLTRQNRTFFLKLGYALVL